MDSRYRIDNSADDRAVSGPTLSMRWRAFHSDERGVTATEYVVLLVLVAAAIIAVIAVFGEQIERLYHQAVEVLRRDVANQ